MTTEDAVRRGSETAKAGFRNEADVIDRFNHWQTDEYAPEWLKLMGYDLADIEFVRAVKVRGSYKADVQVQIQISIKLKSQVDVQNLQVKLVSNPHGFNQIDKRWVQQYSELWNIPPRVERTLKLFTGELGSEIASGRDPRRTFLDEVSEQDRRELLEFFTANRTLIVTDILKGRGRFSAEWFLVIVRLAEEVRWVLKPINYVLNFYGNGEVSVTTQGSLRIGRITMQRKGGDHGRKTACMLQFKINPALIVA